MIRNCFGFALLCSLIGLKNSRHLPAQPIRCKIKTNRVFPRLARLRVFASSSHWFVVMFTLIVISHCCRGNNYQLMAKSRFQEGTEPEVFVPEVAKQHDVFSGAIAFGVLVSARASF